MVGRSAGNVQVLEKTRGKEKAGGLQAVAATMQQLHLSAKVRCCKGHVCRALHRLYSLTVVKRGKLQWYGHVSRSSGLAKTILLGTVKEGRRQGRHRKRWKDNIREWTGPEFGKSQRAVENRVKWRKLVAKSFVVPQRPSRLRD